MITITKKLLPTNHRLYVNKTYTKTEICIHSTGNETSTADSERRWLDNPSNTRDASWHYVIDEKDCIQAIDDGKVAWHAGDSYGNNYAIGVEICHSGNRQKTLQRAAELTAMLMKQHNIPLNKVKRHFDYSGKSCPSILMANNWQGWKDFINLVEKELKPKAPQWQIDALNGVTTKLNLDKSYWTVDKLGDNVTIGELMGLLNKIK